MRRLAAIALAWFLTAIIALPVAADIQVNTLTTTVTTGASRLLPSGAFTVNPLCKTGIASTTEFRCAFEFDLSGILSEAKITVATLTLRRSAGCSTTNDCPIVIRSYSGDGTADASDVTASASTVTTWTPTNTLAHNVNVLSEIAAHHDNLEHWAGFILEGGASSENPDVQQFSLSSTDLTLSITYIPFPVDITVMNDGTGTGKIVSNSPGISCGSTCTGTFTYAQPLTLTANPIGASIFVTWSGIDCDGGNQTTTCSFIVPSVPGPITATFTSTATPAPSSTAAPATAKPTTKPAGSHAPTHAPTSAAPTAAPTAEGPVATFAPGETLGPTLGPTQPTSDSGGGVPLGPIILIAGIVLAIGVGVGAYMYARRRQGMLPPGA